jgi:hypothetical protein
MGDEQAAPTENKQAELERRIKALEERTVLLRIPDEVDGKIVVYKAGSSANTTDPVAHPLKRVPQGYAVLDQDLAGIVYRDTTNRWDTDRIFLKSSVASVTYRLLVF